MSPYEKYAKGVLYERKKTLVNGKRVNCTTMLFPIRSDETVMETHVAWAANIRRTRHIGDFTKWQSEGDYEKAFGRLLRDLKAGGKNE